MTSGERVTGEELQVLVQYQLIAALQEREHDLAEAQRLAHLGSWVWDFRDGSVTWSDELFRLMGVTERTCTPGLASFLALVHPDDRGRVERLFRASIASHSALEADFKTAALGEAGWLRGRGEIDTDAFGEPARMHGTVQDVTAEVHLQQAITRLDLFDRSLLWGNERDTLGAAAQRTSGQKRHATATTLRRALREGEFLLHYQPKVSIESDRITGVEALVRWDDPVQGLVPPLDFIPVAEDTRLIVPIGAWVIEQACRQLTDWTDRFPRRPALVMSVNVSPYQFGPDLVRVVSGALATSEMDPRQLCLEVTETALIIDVDMAIDTLNQLAAMGVKLSIDDFGTGYSSLSSLKRLPLHELKIDKSFVDGIGHDADDTSIVGATVAMAHSLGLSVTAEGVETEDQLTRLRVIGCQEVQGYLVSRPVPAEAISCLLAAEPVSGWRSAEKPTREGRAADQPFRPRRILVVDDTPDVRQLAVMALKAAGFDAHEASSGELALEIAQTLRPDCVILDVAMPGMGGVEVCRILRSDPLTAKCTILMLSSSTTAEDKIDAFGSGADDYIVKPFSPRDLIGRVSAALRRAPDVDVPLALTPTGQLT